MEQTVLKADPFFQTRSAAMVQLAVFEAVNSVTGEFTPYLEALPSLPGASPEVAAVVAAHRTLASLHPESVAALDLRRERALASFVHMDSEAQRMGVAAGEAAAAAILASRARDGSNLDVPHSPGSRIGDWRPTPPAFAPAIHPNWARVSLFGLEHAAQFRPEPPPRLSSEAYARAYEEVCAVGGVESSARPPDRADVARFYSIVLGVDCHNQAARQVCRARKKSLSECARTLALLTMAISDALVASTEAKFHYELWRPVTAILAAGRDGNPATSPAAEFLPLVTTPAFPSYPSNHAAIAGAACAVLAHELGSEGISFTLRCPKLPELSFHYTSWEQLMDDIDDARIFGGIHFRFDQDAGRELGRRVGSYLVQRLLRPVSATAETS